MHVKPTQKSMIKIYKQYIFIGIDAKRFNSRIFEQNYVVYSHFYYVRKIFTITFMFPILFLAEETLTSLKFENKYSETLPSSNWKLEHTQGTHSTILYLGCMRTIISIGFQLKKYSFERFVLYFKVSNFAKIKNKNVMQLLNV